MDGWSLITGAGIVATGALLFLELVAVDIEAAQAALRALEECERKAARRRAEFEEAARAAALQADVERGDITHGEAA